MGGSRVGMRRDFFPIFLLFKIERREVVEYAAAMGTRRGGPIR